MLKNFIRFDRIIFDSNGELSNKRIAFFLLFMNIITSAAVSIYIPCMHRMAQDLGTVNEMMQMSIVAHLVGEFFGRIFIGPMVNFKGFKKVIVPSLIISILGHLGCSVSTSFPLFVCMRFIQAIGASVVYIVSLSIINDLFEEKERAGIVGILELYQPIAWIVSPFAGAILSEIGHWRLLFLALMSAQIIGLLFFIECPEKKKFVHDIPVFSLKSLFNDYRSILKDSYFMIYALIPGLFAGGYMIFAVNCPFICSHLSGSHAADVAIFSAIPLVFYVGSTFVYRSIVKNAGMRIAKWIGVIIYGFFGLYVFNLSGLNLEWSEVNLLTLMCLQCMGSAFLVPVAIVKALKSMPHISGVAASSVVVFRNIVMSVCISLSTKFNSSITTIMSCVFMTVGTILMLITTRRIIKVRRRKKAEQRRRG